MSKLKLIMLNLFEAIIEKKPYKVYQTTFTCYNSLYSLSFYFSGQDMSV